MEILLIGNDQVVEVVGLRDAVSGGFLNNIVVTVRLKDLAGVDVSGQSWPLTLTYIPTNSGHYRGVFEDTLDLKPNKRYIIEITADDGAGTIGLWHYTRTAQYRTPEQT